MAKLVRHLTSNEEIVSSNLAEGIIFCFLVTFFIPSLPFNFLIEFLVDYMTGASTIGVAMRALNLPCCDFIVLYSGPKSTRGYFADARRASATVATKF